MHPVLSNLPAIIGGIIIGSLVNMALIIIGPILIPPPEGVDTTNMESLAAGMELMGPQHFLFPFLAHALGTLAGATIVYRFARRNRQLLGVCIGIFFLFGGITAARTIPAPTWFIVVDLIFAYLPMAWLGIQIGQKWSGNNSVES